MHKLYSLFLSIIVALFLLVSSTAEARAGLGVYVGQQPYYNNSYQPYQAGYNYNSSYSHRGYNHRVSHNHGRYRR